MQGPCILAIWKANSFKIKHNVNKNFKKAFCSCMSI